MKILIKRTSLVLVAFVLSLTLLSTQSNNIDLRAGEEDIPSLYSFSIRL